VVTVFKLRSRFNLKHRRDGPSHRHGDGSNPQLLLLAKYIILRLLGSSLASSAAPIRSTSLRDLQRDCHHWHCNAATGSATGSASLSVSLPVSPTHRSLLCQCSARASLPVATSSSNFY
jgi:hypothetical protein